jgi:hypothetical protein
MYEHIMTSDINERVKLWTTILLLNMLTFSFTHIQCIIYFHGSVLFFRLYCNFPVSSENPFLKSKFIQHFPKTIYLTEESSRKHLPKTSSMHVKNVNKNNPLE